MQGRIDQAKPCLKLCHVQFEQETNTRTYTHIHCEAGGCSAPLMCCRQTFAETFWVSNKPVPSETLFGSQINQTLFDSQIPTSHRHITLPFQLNKKKPGGNCAKIATDLLLFALISNSHETFPQNVILVIVEYEEGMTMFQTDVRKSNCTNRDSTKAVRFLQLQCFATCVCFFSVGNVARGAVRIDT